MTVEINTTRETLRSLKIVADNAREARDSLSNVYDLKVALDRIADRLDYIIRRAL